MSGFDSSRFLGLTEFQTTHMSCGICIKIMNKPVETQCRHTFCKFCIDEWLKKKKSCPECHQKLGNKRKRGSDVEYYSETSKKYNDMFTVLDIRCEFEGCHQIIKLENIEKHSEECNFNKCNDCGLRMGKKSEHNCIELLKKVLVNYEKAYKRVSGVNVELNKTLTEERNFFSETEKELKDENEKYRQSVNEINSKIVDKDIILMEFKLQLTVTNDCNKRITEENINLNKTLTEERKKVLEIENQLKSEIQKNNKYQELEKSYQELEQRVINCELIEFCENDNKKLVAENNLMAKEMNRLKDIENKYKTVELENNRLKNIEKVYNQSKQTENEMNGKIIEMNNEIKIFKEENNNMKNSEKELIESKLENHRVMELNKKFEKDMKELEQKLIESKNEYRNRNLVYDSANECLIKRIKEMENELKTFETENKRLKGIEKDLNLKFEALMTENNEIKKQNRNEVKDHKNNPIKTLKNRIKELEEENMDLKKTIDQYRNGLVERNNCYLGEYSGTQLKCNQSKANNKSGDNSFSDLIKTNEDLPQLCETLQEKLIEKDFQIKQLIDNEDNGENGAENYREIVNGLEVQKENLKKMFLGIYENS